MTIFFDFWKTTTIETDFVVKGNSRKLENNHLMKSPKNYWEFSRRYGKSRKFGVIENFVRKIVASSENLIFRVMSHDSCVDKTDTQRWLVGVCWNLLILLIANNFEPMIKKWCFVIYRNHENYMSILDTVSEKSLFLLIPSPNLAQTYGIALVEPPHTSFILNPKKFLATPTL